MNLTPKYIFRLLLLSFVASSCIEPYYPSETLSAPDVLVIDGSINTTDQSAWVKITHAVALTSVDPPAAEPYAQVNIEELGGGTYALPEDEPGVYYTAGIPIDLSKKYRLNILTAGGKRYSSQYIDLLEAPPIDSLAWRPTDENIEILVNSHDYTGKSKYFKWRYEETWKYNSRYQSSFIFDPESGEVTWRELADQNFECFRTASSTGIVIGSTNQLTEDVVKDIVVATIPAHSYKLSRTYSIVVKQSVLSEEAFTYWQLLQRTTQNLGTLFDPMPGRVTGNITCTSDTSEPVLGYFSGGSETEHRIFIKGNDVPNHLRYIHTADANCSADSILFDDMPTSGNYFVINTYGVPFPVGYTLSSYYCTDCRAQGGTLEVPEFWEE
jgi:hypothetical protein